MRHPDLSLRGSDGAPFFSVARRELDVVPHDATRLRKQIPEYLRLFKHVDPRDFKVTGECRPIFFYSLDALRFFSQPLLRSAR